MCCLIGSSVALMGLHAATAGGEPYLEFHQGDEAEYHAWAQRIAAGEWIRERAFFTTPLYAWFLAGLQGLCGESAVAVRWANVALGAGAVWLAWRTARLTLSVVGSTVALALAAFAFPLLFSQTFAEKTSLVLFATTAALFLSVRALERRHTGPRGWLGVGVAIGVAALAHALALVMLPAVWAAQFACRRPWLARVREALLLGAGALLAVSPATLHNGMASHDFVLIAANTGQNFYTGNHAGNATGLYTSPPFARAWIASEEDDFRAEAERRTGRELRPSEVSAFWLREGWREMLEDPARAWTRFLRKVRWSLNDHEVPDTRTPAFYAARLPVLGLPLPGFGLTALLGLLGATMLLGPGGKAPARRHVPHMVFIALFAVGLGLFFVYGRYRLPMLVPLAILAGAGVDAGAAWVRDRQHVRWLVPAALALPLVWLVYGEVLPGTRRSTFFPDHFNQGMHLQAAGRHGEAADALARAVRSRPFTHPLREEAAQNAARLYVLADRPAEARSLLMEVLAGGGLSPAGRAALTQRLVALPAPESDAVSGR